MNLNIDCGFIAGKLCTVWKCIACQFSGHKFVEFTSFKRINLKCKHECCKLGELVAYYLDMIFTISNGFVAKMLSDFVRQSWCMKDSWITNNDGFVHNHKFAREYWQQPAVIKSLFAFQCDLQHKFDCVKIHALQLFIIINLRPTKYVALRNYMRFETTSVDGSYTFVLHSHLRITQTTFSKANCLSRLKFAIIGMALISLPVTHFIENSPRLWYTAKCLHFMRGETIFSSFSFEISFESCFISLMNN